MTKITLLKHLDTILGPLAVKCISLVSGDSPPGKMSPRRVLFIRPGGLGDAALLVPAILDFKETYPDTAVSVLAEKRNGAVFALCPAIDRLYLYDCPSDLVKAVTAGYDTVIDTEQWHRFSAIVARLTQAPIRVGFATNERKRLFTFAIPYSQSEYEVESFKRLLAPLSVSGHNSRMPFLTIPADADARVIKLLGDITQSRFITLFPGASIPERRWGSDNFRVLAGRLNASGVRVVVIGGKEDAAAACEICRDTGSLQLAGKTTLVATAALLARSSLLVTGDSGLLHIAAGLGVPTVSLFGPGIEEKWAPKGDIHTAINRKVDCSPCTRFGTTPPCPDNGRCIQEISVQEVLEAVRQLLECDKRSTHKACRI